VPAMQLSAVSLRQLHLGAREESGLELEGLFSALEPSALRSVLRMLRAPKPVGRSIFTGRKVSNNGKDTPYCRGSNAPIDLPRDLSRCELGETSDRGDRGDRGDSRLRCTRMPGVKC